MTNLEHIYFNNNYIKPDGCKYLFDAFSELENLKSFHIVSNYVKRKDIDIILEQYADNSNIRKLISRIYI